MASRLLAMFTGNSRDNEADGAAGTTGCDQLSAQDAAAPWDQGLLKDSVRQGLAEGRVWTSRSKRLAAARHFGSAALRPICSYESVPVVRAAHSLSCAINQLFGAGNDSKPQVCDGDAAQDGPWRHRAREQAKVEAVFRVDVSIRHNIHFACVPHYVILRALTLMHSLTQPRIRPIQTTPRASHIRCSV